MADASEHSLLCAASAVELRDMWAEDFVPAEAIEVDVESLDIDGSVGSPCDSIDNQDSARDLMDHIGNLADGVASADNVRYMIASHNACLCCQQRLECFQG